MRNLEWTAAVILAHAAAGCGDRDPVWDAPVGPVEARGLVGSVALIDAPADRVLLLPVEADLQVAPVSIPIGRGFAAASTTPDAARLLVLSRGDMPRRRAEDQAPSLVLIDGGSTPTLAARYELSDPFSALAMDPQEELAVVYPAPDDVAFVQNPNELMVVDLARGPAADNPMPVTLRSFGGRPRAISFTPKLSLPGGVRRLIVVQTDRDVALLDLADLHRPDITVKLTSSGGAVTPAGIDVHDGAPDRDDDARIAVRLENQPDVVILDLLPVPLDDQEASPQTFRPVPNVVDVGGIPSDVAFVRTDGGLRLAAAVPSRQALSLVDPETGVATEIALGAPFEKITVVTDVVGATDKGSDVALLWSASSPNIAFVTLGVTVGTPYKSVDRLELAEPVAAVLDVPAPNSQLKVLASPGGRSFVVLDLPARTAAPILASAANTQVKLAPNGQRAWMAASGHETVAALELLTLHPRSFALGRPVKEVFDVARRDGGRAVVAIHEAGAVGVTVLDAEKPSLETAREYAGVLLGGFE